MSENGVIGRDGALPWRLPDDMKHFRQITLGHPVIMGRRTFEGLAKPLPGRTNIVLTRDSTRAAAGTLPARSIEAAIDLAKEQPGADRICVIGGGEVYQLALPLADELFITRVHATIEGDTHFPPVNWSEWQLVEQSHHAADERHHHAFTMQRHIRDARK
jgi:dihydrofolate reductase